MLSPTVHRKLTQYAKKTVFKAKAKLKRKPLSSNSALVKSIDYKIVTKGTWPSVEFYYNDYGEYVDSGRRRGAKPPPVRPIQDWIRKKGLDLNAYAVAKSISKNGIPAYPWLDECFPSNRKPNSRASLELQYLMEEIIVDQIEYDIDTLED